MNETMPVSPIADFKDRRGGLIGFGILVIAIGCLCALCVPMIFFAHMMAAHTTGAEPNYRIIIPGALVYTVMAGICISLGIGSIMARRWARALLLILSWIWLVSGVIGTVVMAVVMRKVFANLSPDGNPMPEAARAVMMVVMAAILGVVYVVLPGLLLLFYKSRHVKATCEARDPVPRWTDACPLPVLALSLLLASGAASMLFMLVAYHGVMPFFGRLVSGAPGMLFLLGLALVWSYCAWAMYRLKPAGWWIALIGHAIMMASVILTFARVDLMDMYRLMGYPARELERLQQFNFLSGEHLLWLIPLWALPLFGFMLYVKKFFRASA